MSKTIKVSNGDWDVDERGRSSYVGSEVEGSSGREKCAQDVACCLLQDTYEDNSWGSALGNIEKAHVLDSTSAHRSLIQTMVSESMERLITKQGQIEDLPDTERIKDYTVTVNKIASQALSYAFYLAVTTVAGEDVPLENPYVIELEQVNDPNYSQSAGVV